MMFALESLPEMTAYLAVFVAAAVEGEVIFVSSCILVGQGRLSAGWVILAAALGGSLGDQLYFYALRGKLSHWLGRFRRLAEHRQKLITHVDRYSTSLILASRFLPGLRIAIPVACACARISPLKFSLLSLSSGLAWAISLVVFVSYLGPQALAWLGLGTWSKALIPVLVVLGFAYWISRKFSRDSWNGSATSLPEPPTMVSGAAAVSGQLRNNQKRPKRA